MKNTHQTLLFLCCLLGSNFIFLHPNAKAQTYFADALTVFNNNGCLGCHGSQGNLNLNTYASTIAGGNCGDNVIPFDAAASLLVDKIDGGATSCGGKMPPSGNVGAADVAIIEAWINEGALETAPAAPVYFDDVLTIFNNNGCLGCHGSQGNLNLNTYASTIAGGNCGNNVVAFDAAASLLVDKIDGGATSCGGKMPPSGNVGAADVATIEQWINEGALEMAGPAMVTVNLNAQLEGAFDAASGMMNTTLRNNNLLPLDQPYTSAPWIYSGSESYASATSIPNNAVDWVLVEAWSANTFMFVDRKAGMLLNDGTIVNTSNAGLLEMEITDGSAYYFVVQHRNHLAVMTNAAVTVPNSNAYNFATGITQAYGDNQMAVLANGTSALFVGDFNGDGVVSFEDFNVYSTATGINNVYSNADANLDGNVTSDDFNLYFSNAPVIGIEEIRY